MRSFIKYIFPIRHNSIAMSLTAPCAQCDCNVLFVKSEIELMIVA